VDPIEEAFNRAEDAMMTVYADTYRYQDLTKADMRTIWKGFFEQYDRIATIHAFSCILVTPGDPPTAQITCTGALSAILDGTDQRVSLSSWAGDIHRLMYEDGAWRVLG
jgi:hypothetical protein